jgi:NAD(P)-dependent dehydrogenase (short-subunit alcohol dehydrogenase family)
MPTEHRIAVITGAAQGIGRQTALTLAARGYSLALNDVNSCAETCREAAALGAQAHEFPGDITGEAFVARLASEVESRYARVDVLVNNAGISFISPAETVSAQDFRRVLEVNLVAPFVLSKAFGQTMLEGRRGSIVNVASIAGLAGIADRSAYNASKHGLIGLTRVSGLGEDRNGPQGSSPRRLLRSRHHRAHSHGPLRLPRRHRQRHRLPGR